MARINKEEYAYYERELNSIRDMLAQAGVMGIRTSTYYRGTNNKKNLEIIKAFQLLNVDWKVEEWAKYILIVVKPWVDPNEKYLKQFM